MSRFRSKRLTRLLLKFPGYNRLGIYAFLPVFFFAGAALEFTMINWHFGEANFYKTYKRRQAKERAEEIVNNYLLNREQSMKN